MLGSAVAPAPVLAQHATAMPLSWTTLPRTRGPYAHSQKVRTAYDSVADSTHLTVRTHKGVYFFTKQRPRLTWWVAYRGRSVDAASVPEVVLEFRTQNPQVALNSRLELVAPDGRLLQAPSQGSRSDPGVQTWSHFMEFRLPTAALAELLASDSLRLTVGGITERLRPEHVHALRDLLDRVHAWPPTSR